jgi:predicted CXXCH cytochrome family protein
MRILFATILLAIGVSGDRAPVESDTLSITNYPGVHPGAYYHSDLANDSCFACHNEKTLNLKQETVDLCYPCHDAIQAKSAKSFRHINVVSEKYPEFECEGCHRIHRATGNHFLESDELELCRRCHEETKHYKSHPVVSFINVDGRQADVVGRDGRMVTCASHCHDVHGADHGFLCQLEPGRQLCVSCHTEFE